MERLLRGVPSRMKELERFWSCWDAVHTQAWEGGGGVPSPGSRGAETQSHGQSRGGVQRRDSPSCQWGEVGISSCPRWRRWTEHHLPSTRTSTSICGFIPAASSLSSVPSGVLGSKRAPSRGRPPPREPWVDGSHTLLISYQPLISLSPWHCQTCPFTVTASPFLCIFVSVFSAIFSAKKKWSLLEERR